MQVPYEYNAAPVTCAIYSIEWLRTSTHQNGSRMLITRVSSARNRWAMHGPWNLWRNRLEPACGLAVLPAVALLLQSVLFAAPYSTVYETTYYVVVY